MMAYSRFRKIAVLLVLHEEICQVYMCVYTVACSCWRKITFCRSVCAFVPPHHLRHDRSALVQLPQAPPADQVSRIATLTVNNLGILIIGNIAHAHEHEKVLYKSCPLNDPCFIPGYSHSCSEYTMQPSRFLNDHKWTWKRNRTR